MLLAELKKQALPGGKYGTYGLLDAQLQLVKHFLSRYEVVSKHKELVKYLKYMMANPGYSFELLQEQQAQLLALPFHVKKETINATDCLVDHIFEMWFSEDLKNLDISKENIESQDFKYLAQALGKNKALTHLNFRHNHSSEGIKYLTECLKKNKHLLNLGFINNNLDTKAIQYLVESLKINNTLTNFDLSYSYLGDEKIQYLAEALKVNKALTFINLSYNNLSARGLGYLIEALKNNMTLTHLKLSHNCLSKRFSESLSNALMKNNTLLRLDLENNSLTPANVNYLAEGLKTNTKLRQLNIAFNDEDEESAKYLAEALETNVTLIEMDVAFKKTNNIYKTIQNSINRNRCIVALMQGIKTVPQINIWLKNTYKMHVDINAEILHQASEKIKQFPAAAFVTMILLSDGYLKQKKKTPKNTARFFKIAGKLNMDIKMVLAHRLFGSDREMVSTEETEKEVKRVFGQFLT